MGKAHFKDTVKEASVSFYTTLSAALDHLLHHEYVESSFARLEEMTGMKRDTLFLIGAGTLLLFFFFSKWARIALETATLTLLVIWTVKDLDAGANSEHWLRFWVVFGIVAWAESTLRLPWIPYYSVVRMALLFVLASAPTTTEAAFTRFLIPGVRRLADVVVPLLPKSLQ